MSDTPISNRGLLGAWFFDERFYDSGRDRITPVNPVGYPADLRNGVTVGVEGDPEREFGAADFDASSNQFAQIDDPLAVGGSQAVTMVVKVDSRGETGFDRLFTNRGNGGMEIFKTNDSDDLIVEVGDGTTDIPLRFSLLGAGKSEFLTITTFVNDGVLGAYVGGILSNSKEVSGVTAGTKDAAIGAISGGGVYLDGEIAAVGRYDLTVPGAPEPSEIAQRWDRLTDIPGTR